MQATLQSEVEWEERLASNSYFVPLEGVSDNHINYAILERLDAAVKNGTSMFSKIELRVGPRVRCSKISLRTLSSEIDCYTCNNTNTSKQP